MIYDCFTFFNELDLLEIRLNELNQVVDKFVLVESNRTFTNQPKPLFFEDNKKRFEPFLDKIIHIVVRKHPTFFYKFRPTKTWDFENNQRESIKLGLKNCKADDVIIISDVDEIPKAEKVKLYAQQDHIKVFEQDLFYYFLNCICTEYVKDSEKNKAQGTKNGKGYWRGSVMLNYEDIHTIKKSRMLRDTETKQINIIEEGGWHFSFLGGLEKVITKLNAYSHAGEAKYNPEYLKKPEEIEKLMNSGLDLFGRDIQYKFINIDTNFPNYLLSNQEKFAHLIKSAI